MERINAKKREPVDNTNKSENSRKSSSTSFGGLRTGFLLSGHVQPENLEGGLGKVVAMSQQVLGKLERGNTSQTSDLSSQSNQVDRLNTLLGDSQQPVNSPERVVARVRPAIFEVAERMSRRDSATFKKIFDDRIAVESMLAAYYRREQDSDRWTSDSGLYVDKNCERTRLTDELYVSEFLMNAQIKELLTKREKTGNPVTVVDFGGGLGLSMVRLAAKNKEAIKSGDLVIVVTNISYLPETAADSNGYSGVARSLNKRNHDWETNYSKEELRFVQQNQELVTYINAIATEIPSKLVQHQGKQPMSLESKVDIIHEHGVLRHTHAPDIALAVFGELLSDKGTLYIYADESANMCYDEYHKKIQLADGKTLNLADESSLEARHKALIVGIELLREKYNMKRVYTMPGKVSVFTKPDAPDFLGIASKA